MTNSDLQTLLVKLERELHNPSTHHKRARLAELLHPDFLEFGRSGRSYTFAEIVEHLSAAAPEQPWLNGLKAQNFKLRLLQDGLALLTYQSVNLDAQGQPGLHALRSSIWQQNASGWQMIFHQGTPTAVFALQAE
ncbi:DUF4440 domain-containing protein [Massilia sp. W12]|uniref:nuclear transport factor 2 family protein n=1 Tax=Massilia sp. W12 TaxID=3126507 RepID=UPI0030D102E5